MYVLKGRHFGSSSCMCSSRVPQRPRRTYDSSRLNVPPRWVSDSEVTLLAYKEEGEACGRTKKIAWRS